MPDRKGVEGMGEKGKGNKYKLAVTKSRNIKYSIRNKVNITIIMYGVRWVLPL